MKVAKKSSVDVAKESSRQHTNEQFREGGGKGGRPKTDAASCRYSGKSSKEKYAMRKQKGLHKERLFQQEKARQDENLYTSKHQHKVEKTSWMVTLSMNEVSEEMQKTFVELGM